MNPITLVKTVRLLDNKIMKKHKGSEAGFVPLLLMLVAVILFVVIVVFLRVKQAQQ